MKRNLIAVCLLSFGIAGMGMAQGTASSTKNDTQYTKAQLHQLSRDAGTPEQYSELASYYANQQSEYVQQARAEKQEWIRRNESIVSIAAKYPRPVDSARYLYEYYAYQASKAGQLTAKYSQLAAPADTK